MMALRANVLAKGFSGIRLETLELLVELLNQRRPSGRAVARIGRRERRPRAAGAPRARPDRRRRSVARRRARAWRQRAGARRRRAGDARAEGRARAHQRHAAVDGAARPGAGRGAAAGARGRYRRRAQHRRPAGVDAARSTRGFTRPAAFAGPARIGGQPAALLDGQRHQRRRTPTAAACRTPIPCAARRRCTARRATPSRLPHGVFDAEANAATDNPMVFADAREIVSGGNFHGAPVASPPTCCASALAQLATISERRSDRLRQPGAAAGCPRSSRATAACSRA